MIEEPLVARLAYGHAAPDELHDRGGPRALDGIAQADEEPDLWAPGSNGVYALPRKNRVRGCDLAGEQPPAIGRGPVWELQRRDPCVSIGMLRMVPVVQLLASRKDNLRMALHLAMEPGGAALLRADAEKVDSGQFASLVRSRMQSCGNASAIIECDSGPR